MILFLFALSCCAGALFAATRLGRLPVASPKSLLRVLRPVALVVLVSVVFGALIGFATAKRDALAPASSMVREARQRLDPKIKTNDPGYWKQQLAEGEAKLVARASASMDGTLVLKGVARTTSITLFLAGLLGSLALIRFRAEQ
ncbi:hypothetical protein [Armatimonas sp.]|uniref:hypothetical protein n=1 Tax=Armatimonas sp. TaxID=1872638 RepID=UPI003750408A